jgi:hypothetical protein
MVNESVQKMPGMLIGMARVKMNGDIESDVKPGSDLDYCTTVGAS